MHSPAGLACAALILVSGCATAPQRVERPPLADIAWPDDSRATQLLVLNRVGFGANASSLLLARIYGLDPSRLSRVFPGAAPKDLALL